MLREHEEVAEFYRRQFQFILVDEYQDTNKIQADFIDLLAAEHGNVMVVGDDAQSIYSWRGANFQNILAFPRRYPNAQVFKIEINYRSVPEILARRQRRHRAEHAAVPQKPHRRAPNDHARARDGGAERRRRAGAIRRATHSRAARRRRRAERNRGALPRALSRGGIAAGTLAPRHSVSDHERPSFLRAGAHQGRRGVHPLRRQSARRSCFQTHGPAAAGHRRQERGESLAGLGEIVRRERRHRFLGRKAARRCRSPRARKNRGINSRTRSTKSRRADSRIRPRR